LEKQVRELERKTELQEAVIESIEGVNQVLSEDDEAKKLLWTTGFPHNVKPEIAEKIQSVLKKNSKKWGWQQLVAQTCACPRQRISQILERNIKSWKKPNHTPKNNGNQCTSEIEQLIVHLVKDDFNAPYNATAKHAAMITGEKVSANLVKGVRKRNDLEKKVEKKGSAQKIKTSYQHVVSVDVVRESGLRIYGFIQDKTKVVYHHLAENQTSAEAKEGLKAYISMYGKPDAVRSDHGAEFKGVFAEYLDKEAIDHIRPLPYNPKANGFIERYFRTLRKMLFRRLKNRSLKLTQADLDDFAFIWNYCRQAVGTMGNTPAELADLYFPQEMLKRFKLIKQTVGNWTFWHIHGVHGLLHAYLPEKKLRLKEQNGQQKVA